MRGSDWMGTRGVINDAPSARPGERAGYVVGSHGTSGPGVQGPHVNSQSAWN